MPLVAYDLDNAINSFFSDAGASTSRAECDAVARQRCGGQVRPVAVQGMSSYAVIAGLNDDRIIQFRDHTDLLDTAVIALAKDIHGHLVAGCSEAGRVGDEVNGSSHLVVYEMDRLLGENCVTARFSLGCDKRLNIVRGLAEFVEVYPLFLSSCQPYLGILTWSKVSLPKRRTKASQWIQDWSTCLPSAPSVTPGSNTWPTPPPPPERFQPAVAEARAALPSLLDGVYPVVLTHGDLNEMNILISPKTGEITGIVDWSSASMQPFGLSLYALEDVLGDMRAGGWEWYDGADGLRAAFWTVFRERTGLSEAGLKLPRLAGRAGILFRYGTAHDAGFSGPIGVGDPEMGDFGYLDALL